MIFFWTSLFFGLIYFIDEVNLKQLLSKRTKKIDKK